MNRKVILTSALLLGIAAATPAAADLVRLGSVYFMEPPSAKQPITFQDFGAAIDRVGFRAADGSIECDTISATFADGKSYDLFKGYLESGHVLAMPLPGGESTIRRLEFNCHPESPLALGGLDVLVDPGIHEREWRQSPDWNSKWWYRFEPKLPG